MEPIFNNDRPIYIQIIEQLKMDIICGKFKSGERLPSVRELAITLKVNPNTIQKALSYLEDSKLIYTERTNGKYVTQDGDLIGNIKKEIIMNNINIFFEKMRKLGLSKEESIKILNNLEAENGIVRI